MSDITSFEEQRPGPRRLSRTGRWLAGAAAAAAVALGAPEARASAFDDLGAGLIVVGSGMALLGAADMVFVVNDMVDLANGWPPDKGWALAEAIVATPQALAFNALLFAMAHDDDDDNAGALFLGVPFTAAATSLTIHGIWASTGDPATNEDRVGVSVFVGTAGAWTSAALGRATRGGLFPRSVGVAEMALTSPGLAVGIYESLPGRPSQATWIPVAAWSGLMWLHGLASVIANDEGPPGRGSRPGGRASSLRPSSPSKKTGLSWTLAPTVLPGIDRPAPGVAAAGVF